MTQVWRNSASPFRIPRQKWLRRAGKWARSLVARPAKNPILVFGNQKSGTSAIASLLGAATGLRAQIDLAGTREPGLTPLLRHEIPIAEFVRRNAAGFSARIVKDPSLTFLAPQLLDYFPAGQAVFIVREPFQNIRSILNRLKIPGDLEEFVPTLDGLPNSTWLSILSGADLALPAMHYVDTLAQRWMKAADVYLSQPRRYVLVRYEDFNREKKRCIEGLARKLGLSPDRPFEHLLDHQFQPAGRSDMPALTFFGRRNWDRIARACRPSMNAFGYDLAEPADPSLILR